MEPTARLTTDHITRLPPEALALELLQCLPEHRAVRRDHFLRDTLHQAQPRQPAGSMTGTDTGYLGKEHQPALMGLVEAWQRLVLDGLLVDWPPKDPRYTSEGHGEIYQLTHWGRRVRGLGADGSALIAARRRLGVELHPQLAGRLRDAVSVAAFEQAALLALRAIEARVRDLTGEPRGKGGERLTGTGPIMRATGGVAIALVL